MKNPFRGLEPYEEKDQLYGRDSDLLILKDRVYAGRVTLLFSAPGAGKTSFLRAKALPEFRNDFYCCYISNWVRFDVDPYQCLLRNIGLAISGEISPGQSLCAVLSSLAFKTDRPDGLLLILDQFEELFQAHGYSEELRTLVHELSALINDDTIPARVIISMRDDFLGSLSVFDNRIPSLFNNYYHLKSPTERQAREIIRLTARDNKKEPDPVKLKILTTQLSVFSIGARGKPELLAQTEKEGKPAEGQPAPPNPSNPKLLKDRIWTWLLRRARTLKRVFSNPPAGPQPKIVKLDSVILPYLQIVCREVWEKESKNESAKFLHSWDSTKSPAAGILRAACRRSLEALGDEGKKRRTGLGSPGERKKKLASRAFDYLMTQQGAKLPYEWHILAEHMAVDSDELYEVLHYLSKAETRILREYRRPDYSIWFELYHDMYAVILQDWKREQESQAVWKHRGWLAWVALTALLIACSFFWYRSFVRYSSKIEVADEVAPLDSYKNLKKVPFFRFFADSELADYWERRAQATALQEDAGRSLLYRFNALELSDKAESRVQAYQLNSLVKGVRKTFRPSGGGTISALAFSPDEKYLALGTSDGGVEVWEVDPAKRVLLTKMNICNDEAKALSSQPTGDPIHKLAFSADTTRVAARTAGGQAQTWGWGQDSEKCSDLWTNTSLISFAADGHNILVAYPSGSMQEWIDKKAGWSVSYPIAAIRPKLNPDEKTPSVGISNVVLTNSDKKQNRTKHIFAGDTVGNVYAWNEKKGVTQIVKGSGVPAVLSPTFNHERKLEGVTMVVLSSGQFQLWHLMQKGEKREQRKIKDMGPGPKRPFASSYTPDGSFVLVSSGEQMQVYNVRTGKLESALPIEEKDESAQLVSRELLWVTNQVQTPALMQAATGKITRALPEPVSQFAFSRNSRWLATAGKDSVHLWDPQKLAWSEQTDRAVAVSGDGRVVALYNGNGELMLQDTLSRKNLWHAAGGNPLAFVSLSHDGKIAAILNGGRLALWSGGKEIDAGLPDNHKVQSADFSPQGQTILISYADGVRRTLTISDDLKPSWSLPFASRGEKFKFRFTPDGNALLVFSRRTLQIRRCADFGAVGKEIMFSDDIDEPVLAFLPDGRQPLLAVFTGAQVQIVDWKTGVPRGSLEEPDQPSSILFRPDGKQLIGVFANNLKWWHVNERGQLSAVPPVQKDASVDTLGYSTAFYWVGSKQSGGRSPDYLLTVVGDGRVLQLRDAGTGAAKGSPVRLGATVLGVVWFTQDGSRAIVPTTSGWLHTFRVEDDRLIPEGNEFMGGAPSLPVGMVGDEGAQAVSLVIVGARQRLSVVNMANLEQPELKGNWKELSVALASRLGLDETGRPR